MGFNNVGGGQIAAHRGNVVGTYKAMATWTNTHQAPNVLDFRVGDTVHVLNNTEDPEWWYGYVSSADGRTKEEGYFPASYIETMDRATGLRAQRPARVRPKRPSNSAPKGAPSAGEWTKDGFVPGGVDERNTTGGWGRGHGTGSGGGGGPKRPFDQPYGRTFDKDTPQGGAVIEMINGVPVGPVVDERDAVPLGKPLNAVDPSLVVGINHVATTLVKQREEERMISFDNEAKARTLTTLQNEFFGTINLMAKGRWLIKAGLLGKKGGFGYEPRMFFLFNDMIIYARLYSPQEAMARSRREYGIHGRINDNGRKYEFRKKYIIGRNTLMEDRWGCKFAIQTAEHPKVCEIKCPNKQIKSEWMTLIRQCMAGKPPLPASFRRGGGGDSISIPSSIREWTVLNVGSWLLLTGFDQYIKKFKTNGIDGPQLLRCDDKRLYDMGVSADHRLKMLREVARLAKNSDGTHAPVSATRLNATRRSSLGNFFAGVAEIQTFSTQGLVNNRPTAPQPGTFIPHVGLKDAVKPAPKRAQQFRSHEEEFAAAAANVQQQQPHTVFYPIGSAGAKAAATGKRREHAAMPGRR